MNFSIGIKSLLLQLGSLLLISVILNVVTSILHISFSLFSLLFLHACLAAYLSFFLKFDWWWAPIQFCFPLLAYFLLQFEISPFLYLIALLIFSALYWSTYRTQVPYFPSRPQLIEPIFTLLADIDDVKFVDIGSGMGGLLISLSTRRRDGQFYGVEIAPLPWLISVVRAWVQRSSAHFQLGNFYHLNVSEFDVVFCYLSPAAMESVWEKLRREMRPGALFLSYEFIVPSALPDISIQIGNQDEYLYGWRI